MFIVSVVGQIKDPNATEDQVKSQLQNCIGNSHSDRRSSGHKDQRRKVNLATKFGKGQTSDSSTDEDVVEAEKNDSTLPPEPVTPTTVEAPSFPSSDAVPSIGSKE